MNERNDTRIFPNSSYDNRFNIPFSSNQNPAYMPTSVPPFQSMPFQSQYYSSQPVNIPMGVQFPCPDKNHVLPNPSLHNHYYTDIPTYTDERSKRPNTIPNPVFSNVYPSNEQYGYSYDSNHVKNYRSDPMPKSNELQVSAQTFVPKNVPIPEQVFNEKSSDNRTMHQVVDSSVNVESISNTSIPVQSYDYLPDTKDVGPQFINHRPNYNNSTRPKEFNKGRGNNNRKNWIPNKQAQNWQNRERSYNQGFNNFHPNIQSPNTPEILTPFQKNDYNLENSKRPQNKMKPQNRGNLTYNEFNGFNNGRGRKNPMPNRQNYNPKRSEWRRSNGNGYDYNYYDEGRNAQYQQHQQQQQQQQHHQQQPAQSNNYNKRAPRWYNTYPNESMKENNFEYSNYKEQEYRENKFGKEWNPHSGSKSNYSHPRNGAVTSSEYTRKSNGVFASNETRLKGKLSETSSDYIIEDSKVDVESEKTLKELKPLPVPNQDDEKLQRENMVDNLSKGLYECMVCCERIKQQHAIWSCSKCFNCFHLGCIKKWAGTSQGEPGWRCPACQNLNSKIPNGYFCFCKKLREPEWNRKEIPHSCGEVCGKRRGNEWCTHKCIILCHPGPCPDCSAFIKRQCQCGKNSKEMRCSLTEPYLCEEKCNRTLNCGTHTCQKVCHFETCEKCLVIIEEKCFCGKETRSVDCTSETAKGNSFSCDSPCSKLLSCGNHSCDQICHEGPCKPCSKAVETVTNCPCGKMNLGKYFRDKGKEERKSCQDPIPTCGGVCGRILKCGPPSNYHSCQSKCHEGLCPPCKSQTAVKCRCGFMDKKIPCTDLQSKADEVTCEKQCKKLRQCGRHKCGLKCCIDIDHLCTRVCGRTLKCRLHKCQEPCHRGNCPRCWETSFEELSCHCGASVLYPPISCGTEPPPCDLPCRRQQACSHSVSHNCHSDPKCPPCTTLVSKPCFGNHTTMKSTPCYVSAMSCGEQCAKTLPCGLHLCQKVCHGGKCIQGKACNQKCAEPRPSCEHPCGNPCHSGTCPDTPCKEMVTVTCVCGNRKTEMVCSENERDYKSMATSRLASELHSLNSGGSVDISQIFSSSAKPEKLKRLECNDECGLIARNRQLALALQITNPDTREALGEGGVNLFSDSVKEEAKKDIQFAQMVHATLNDLVVKAKQSKQKSRSHSFAPMNRDKRRFIHEYSKYFGCQSQSYDEEPKKNVVVTACKSMSRLPPVSVVTLIQKELGQRKGPGPVLNRKALASEEAGSNQMKRLAKTGSIEKKEMSTSPKDSAIIDYFDLS